MTRFALLEHVALHQDVLELLHRRRLDHRRGLPDLEPAVAFGGAVIAFGFTPGKNVSSVLTSSGIGASAVHFMPLAIALVQFWIVLWFSRMYLSVAMKVV